MCQTGQDLLYFGSPVKQQGFLLFQNLHRSIIVSAVQLSPFGPKDLFLTITVESMMVITLVKDVTPASLSCLSPI